MSGGATVGLPARLGLLFGVVVGVTNSLLIGGIDPVGDFVIRAVIYAVALGGVMALIARSAIRKGRRTDPATVRRRVEEDVELPVSADRARELAHDAWQAVPRAEPPAGNTLGDTVHFHVPASANSWGENVVLRVRGDDRRAVVSVLSGSGLRTTLVDFGRNRRNVRRLVAWLREEAAAARASRGA